MTKPWISVIIAARNAAGTIPRAVGSALREPEVTEVLVVDDASSDGTAAAAQAADDSSGRLSIVRLDVNVGPSAARNIGIDRSSAPFIAILDADDCYLEGRFGNIFSERDWDLAADNVMFVEDGAAASRISEFRSPSFHASPRYLGLDEFVNGNISERGMHRGELGFLKPVVSRRFIDRHGLRYDERLRLGEDYEFYARAMIHGARFKITRACGYLAMVRPDSLSGRHSTQDLQRLADADLALLGMEGLQESTRDALRRHERQTRDKYRLRRFLDRKAEEGIASALAFAFSNVANPVPIARGVAADKVGAIRRRFAPHSEKNNRQQVRFLMRAVRR